MKEKTGGGRGGTQTDTNRSRRGREGRGDERRRERKRRGREDEMEAKDEEQWERMREATKKGEVERKREGRRREKMAGLPVNNHFICNTDESKRRFINAAHFYVASCPRNRRQKSQEIR